MLSLSSPAKINLFLRVVQRRPDGYHDLASLFQAVSLTDTIHFDLSVQDQLTCTDPSIPTNSQNLILKAADLFRRKTGMAFGLTVHLEKRIPHQAGLGGGSSNAATTLWALNKMHNNPVTTDQLQQWSAEIGSDIPFFFSQGTAYCTGRGDKVRVLKALPGQNLWVAKPKQGLSTPVVFKKLNLTSLRERNPEESLKSFTKGKPNYFNDLEEPAFAVLPELENIKQQLLQSGFETVLMTGSGTAFVCIGSDNFSKLDNLAYYPVSFLNRLPDAWY